MPIKPSKEKRKKIEDLVITTLKKFDNTGLNAKKYEEKFKAMSDSEFFKYFEEMMKDENNNFYVEIDIFNPKSVNINSIRKSAEYLNVPLEEQVYIQHLSPNGESIKTPYKVPIIYIHIKRMQQILTKKNIFNTEIDKGNTRSRLTGFLNDQNKSGRLTDMDTVSMLSITNNSGDIFEQGLSAITNKGKDRDNYILKEILGFRSDNMNDKSQINTQIALLGQAKMSDVNKELIHSGQALNSLDAYFIASGFKTDLVTGSLEVKQSMLNRNENVI